MHYTGFDLHKKTVSICVKTSAGKIINQQSIPARRQDLIDWARRQTTPWIGIMEATIFTGWVYDTLLPFARQLKVANPVMTKAITASKKKNDKVDSATLADLGRCDWVPECYMMPAAERHLRAILRFRAKLVYQSVRFKNVTAGLLMSEGSEYDKERLHSQRYFDGLMQELTDLPESTRQLVELSHDASDLFQRTQRHLIRQLTAHPQLVKRIELLRSIDGVGEITSLTWALEVGDPQRFPSARRAMSYAGLTSKEDSSGETSRRGPISKQRNRHLQWTLIEAAKLAPRYNAALKLIYDRELQRGNHNSATIAVARKLVAYLLSVDKSGKPFQLNTAASNYGENT